LTFWIKNSIFINKKIIFFNYQREKPMSPKVEFLINEALLMSPSERALLAHSLISSLDEPIEENVDQEWIKLAEKRLTELENNEVTPISWEELKQKVRNEKT
jgi:putative addiction module component (TIGR02574 family)